MARKSTKSSNIIIPKVLSMSSLEIAKLSERLHKNVIRDIEKMFNECEVDRLIYERTYKDGQNRPQKCYELNFEWTVTLISGYNVKLRHAIIQRWQELEKKERDRIETERVWLNERKNTKAAFYEMTDALKEYAIRNGFVAQSWHYAREADMLNMIIAGCTSKQFKLELELQEDAVIRDQMEANHLMAYSYLQRADANLLDMDIPFKERSEHLANAFAVKFQKFHLLQEVKKLANQ